MSVEWGSSPTLSQDELEDAAKYDLEQRLANAHERELVQRLRTLLGSSLTEGRHSHFPEVVGDIALLRYVRGTNSDLEQSAKLFNRHLAMRKLLNLDDVRDKYYPEISSRSNRNYSYSQESLRWGQAVRAYLPMTLDAPLTERGDTICAFWYVSGRLAMLLETHGYKRVMQFTNEMTICRQIQLDLLSRKQQRLARVVILFHAPHGGAWRLATNGPTRDFFRRGNETLGYTMSSTIPGLLARGYVMDDSWGLRIFWNTIMTVLKGYYAPKFKLFGSGQENELIRINLLSRETLSYLAANRVLHNRLKWTHIENSNNSNNNNSNNNNSNNNNNNSKHNFQNDNGSVKTGEAWLQEGGEFEVQIEIAPDEIGKVTWEFKCRCGTPVNFEARIVHMNYLENISNVENSGNVPETLVESKSVVPLRETRWHEGEYEYDINSHSKPGLIVLRWVSKSAPTAVSSSSASSSLPTSASSKSMYCRWFCYSECRNIIEYRVTRLKSKASTDAALEGMPVHQFLSRKKPRRASSDVVKPPPFSAALLPSSSSLSSSSSSSSLSPSISGTQPAPFSSNRVRLSITFKCAKGWRGTKSRDFPGRCFSQHDCSIIQSWAREYRDGAMLRDPATGTLSQENLKRDREVAIQLPHSASRRRPFLGAATVSRSGAFFWFRLMHERLLNAIDKKNRGGGNEAKHNGSKDVDGENGKKLKKTTNKKNKKMSSVPLLIAENASIPTSDLPITLMLPSKYQLSSKASDAFIEVYFATEHPQDKFRLYVIATCTSYSSSSNKNNGNGAASTQIILPINIQNTGRIGIFNAERLQAGDYIINGCSFKLLPKAPAILKKRGRKRKEIKNASLATGSTLLTHTIKPASPVKVGSPLLASATGGDKTSNIAASVPVSHDRELEMWEVFENENMQNDFAWGGSSGSFGGISNGSDGSDGRRGRRGSSDIGQEAGRRQPVSSPLPLVNNILSFEPNAVLVGEDEWIQVLFTPGSNISETIPLLGVNVVLIQHDAEPARRMFASSSLPVGEFCSDAGGKLIVFGLEDVFMH
jgi:hypothetical protein